MTYDLIEILVFHEYQDRGIGTKFIMELERRVRKMGAAIIQLESVNDDQHHRFYGRAGYKNASNAIIKTKFIAGTPDD